MMCLCWRAMNWVVLVPSSMRFALRMASLSRNGSGVPPLLEEVCTSLRDMLEAGAIHPRQSPWCNAVVLVRKKDSTLCFCMDFRRLNTRTKKDSYPLPHIQEALQQYTAFTVVTLGSTSLPACHSGCAMHLRCFSISCRTPWGS